jgi:hypothetical protein
MNLFDIRFVIPQRWQTKMAKSIAPSQAGMSAISKEIRKQYRGLWRVDRSSENDTLRAGLLIRPAARAAAGQFNAKDPAWGVLVLALGAGCSRRPKPSYRFPDFFRYRAPT